jgi:thiol-disulfide isomerase/thioredoxin
VPVKPRFQISLMLTAMALSALLSYGILTNLPDEENSPMVNDPASRQMPEAVFYNEVDERVTLASFRGQVVLVNLWATWCPPCVVELPSLERLQQKLKGKNFRVVAISLDRTSAENVASFLRERDVKLLDVYWDKDRQIPAKWKYAGIPVSFLIDAEGNLVETFEGPREWEQGAVFERISALVN